VVRYRSKRDLLSMIQDPVFTAGAAHKFASLAKNVAVPTRGLLVIHLGHVVPLVLLLGATVAAWWQMWGALTTQEALDDEIKRVIGRVNLNEGKKNEKGQQ